MNEAELNRRLTRLVTQRVARIAHASTGLQGFAGIDSPQGMSGFFSKAKKALHKKMTAPLKVAEKVTHAMVKAEPFLSKKQKDKLLIETPAKVVGVIQKVTDKVTGLTPFISDKQKGQLSDALMKPVQITAAVNKALVTGDDKELEALIKRDVEESKKVLKVVLPVVAVIAQFFPGIGTIIAIVAGLANAALQVQEKKDAAKKLRKYAEQVESQDAALAAEANAQAKLLEEQAAVYETAALYVQQAQRAGFIQDGMNGQQIQDGVAKWSLATRGINLTTGEAQALLTDTIAQANQQQAKQQAQQSQAMQAGTVSSAAPPVSRLYESPDVEAEQIAQTKVQTAGLSGKVALFAALGVAGLLFATARPVKK